ncbi:MAG: hypothetical protein HY900_27385, partial [Deltaproteobacteria bacterium]|nr:hypothetical protein [Deltaproteobacteria bacterium]
QPVVTTVLALVLVTYGVVVLRLGRPAHGGAPGPQTRPRLRSERSAAMAAGVPFLLGAFQGASNPALLLNWTLFISFALGHRLLRADLPGAVGFGVGAGAGAFGWFALLIEVVHRLRSHPMGTWIRNSTAFAGLLLVLFGLLFSWRAASELF